MNLKSNAVQGGKRMYLTRSWASPGPHIEEGDGFRIDNLIRGKTPERADNKYFRDPVIRLMLAVLEDAVNCYVKYRGSKSRRGQRIFREAHEWFFSDDAKWLFSYENICDLVGINPSYLRNGMLRGNYETGAAAAATALENRQSLAADPSGAAGLRRTQSSLVRRTPRLRRLRDQKRDRRARHAQPI
ncbi:MAG TPA: hypothetical protein VNL14_16120 [Candidatus Acidoferrales bacterium]|nr:hypothetical protein [Candidatus Acidoferrales bacterium]